MEASVPVSGSHSCTHSSLGVARQEQAPWAVCSPPALPVGSDSLPYTSSQLNGAHCCFAVILTRPVENHSSFKVLPGVAVPFELAPSPPSLTSSINSGI